MVIEEPNILPRDVFDIHKSSLGEKNPKCIQMAWCYSARRHCRHFAFGRLLSVQTKYPRYLNN